MKSLIQILKSRKKYAEFLDVQLPIGKMTPSCWFLFYEENPKELIGIYKLNPKFEIKRRWLLRIMPYYFLTSTVTSDEYG